MALKMSMWLKQISMVKIVCVQQHNTSLQSAVRKPLSPFLTGQMFVREPSWDYSANPVGS